MTQHKKSFWVHFTNFFKSIWNWMFVRAKLEEKFDLELDKELLDDTFEKKNKTK